MTHWAPPMTVGAMIRPLIFAVLMTQPAAAATVSTWSGATAYACGDHCAQDWAESHLTKDELSQLHAAQKQGPASPVQVHDGDVFALMTYYRDGQARAYRTTTVARLDAPEGATGWDMGDWLWVKLDACSNWAILKRQNVGSGSNMPLEAVTGPAQGITPLAAVLTGASFTGASGDFSGGLSGNWTSPVISQPCVTCSPVPPCPPVAAVPVPASALLLMTALSALLLVRRKKIVEVSE